MVSRFSDEHVSICPRARIVPWLHVDLQRLKIDTIALTRAFSEQMAQVANTGTRLGKRALLRWYQDGSQCLAGFPQAALCR
jgi:hypothetical protein